METKILTDPMIKPDNRVLEAVLGKNYKNFIEFLNKINELNLVLEWRYYNDGKSWLGKLLNKKKNMAWLSVWNTGFKLTFYFTEKTINGVYELDIDEETKAIAKEMKPVGKFRSVILFMKNKKTISNGVKLLEYKMELK